MAESIVERITDDLEIVLAGVRAAAGYNSNLTVERYDPKRGNPPVDSKVVLHALEPIRDVEVEPAGWQAWRQPYELTLFIIDTETDASAPEAHDRARMAASDIIKAVMADPTRDSLAWDTDVDGQTPFGVQDTENHDGMTITITVRFRHLWGDPYSQ